MTVIVEDGSGVANANSYVSINDYKAFASARGITLPKDADIEIQLIKAMDYLEIKPWPGSKSYVDQAVAFPRSDLYYNGDLVLDDIIPTNLAKAQMFLALEVNKGVDLLPTVLPGSFVKREKVGPIETEYSETLNVGIPTFPAVEALLAGYLGVSSGVQFKTDRG